MKWFKSFMEDRTGVDHLSLALLIVSLIISLIGNLLGWSWLAWFSLIPLVLFYFRSFSKNKLKRHQENVLFLKYWYPIQTKWVNQYRMFKAKRQYRYFKCKECGQSLRVPRKKGKIEITCPKCRHTFIKKT
ncbi:zinc-ribbon domain-containing protein [Turicibacter sp. TJ11]|uniref:zinc-ribbon domain-containing protein n=1 Tax=Turicibacter sp. TJ11 TaxID=2806443 RepID=UPI001F2E43E7|nr:zinc-ribbon domain-containing protein [Turicibacter sp. TJ11]